jgi:hypothetical protein
MQSSTNMVNTKKKKPNTMYLYTEKKNLQISGAYKQMHFVLSWHEG